MKLLHILGIVVFLGVIHGSAFAQSTTVSVPTLKYTACEDEYANLQNGVNISGSLEDESLIDIYLQCHYTQGDLFNQTTRFGNELIQEEKYQQALSTFQEARTLVISTFAVDQVIIDLAIALAENAYKNGETQDMKDRLGYAQTFDGRQKRDNFLIFYLYSLIELQNAKRKEANELAKKARTYAETREDIEQIGSLTAYINERLLAPSSDQFSYKQFRISKLAVDDVRTSVPKTTRKPVVVAVIDSGIDIYHPDLQGQIRKNEGEIANNGKDDDRNGYIDDVYGYNFHDKTHEITVTDGHGTLVAGVIGALQNNDLGISGIITHVKIMPVVVCKNEECLPGSELAQAIQYAVDNGADIINMSISSTKSSNSNEALNKAIINANNQNIPVIVAGGNGLISEAGEKKPINTSEVAISPVCNEPLSKKQIIGVGATNNNSQPLPWSNIGKCVDVRAYGEGIVSTSFFSTSEGQYGIAEGTSLAAPMVAGVVGLGQLIHGKQHRKNVYDALQASLNAKNIPQADVYIRELEKRKISSAKINQIENVAIYIHQLIDGSESSQQIELTNTLRRLLTDYEDQLVAKRSYTKLTILYELARSLKQYSLFESL